MQDQHRKPKHPEATMKQPPAAIVEAPETRPALAQGEAEPDEGEGQEHIPAHLHGDPVLPKELDRPGILEGLWIG